MNVIRRAYGSGPYHFVAVVVCFAVSGYAILRLADSAQPVLIGLWFLGALLAHDFLLYPLYTLLDRATARGQGLGGTDRASWINFVRVPVLIVGLVFLVWFPLILGVNAKTYRAASGLGTGRFLGRFLAFTAAVFLVSAALYCLRLLRWQRRAD
ncbi:MAG TPA: hypothetical protein VK988_21145 [Acidimicrobiales bacterium]|nr:hypothetical protein [Acidimicrobiales bacterium]